MRVISEACERSVTYYITQMDSARSMTGAEGTGDWVEGGHIVTDCALTNLSVGTQANLETARSGRYCLTCI